MEDVAFITSSSKESVRQSIFSTCTAENSVCYFVTEQSMSSCWVRKLLKMCERGNARLQAGTLSHIAIWYQASICKEEGVQQLFAGRTSVRANLYRKEVQPFLQDLILFACLANKNGNTNEDYSIIIKCIGKLCVQTKSFFILPFQINRNMHIQPCQKKMFVCYFLDKMWADFVYL